MDIEKSTGGSRITAGKALRIGWELMQGYRMRFFLAIAAMVAATAANFLVPIVGSAAIDLAIRGETASNILVNFLSAPFDMDWVRAHLWSAAGFMVLLTAIGGGFTFLKGRWVAQASEGIARRLKQDLYTHLQAMPLRSLDKHESGDLVQRCTSDVETLRLAIHEQVVQFFHAFILMTAALPLMLLLDPVMTVASVCLLGPIIIYGYLYIGQVRQLFLKVDEAEGAVTACVQENLTGLRVVRAFSRQDYEIDKFKEPNALYRDLGLKLTRTMAIYWSVSDTISLTQNAIVLGVGIHLMGQGELTAGTFFAFLILLNLVLWPIRQLGRTLTEFGKSIVAIGRIREILDEPVESVHPSPVLSEVKGHLLIEGLSYTHQGSQSGLADISLQAEAGETVAIVGPSGAGKSTLMHVLLRLYDYSKGSIRLDGLELREQDRSWCRRQFSTVLQEPFLFSKSIEDNIRLGRPQARREDLFDVAQLAQIDDSIRRFPEGYETLVGERGVTLSGGQRQRVAIARALLRDAPFLLLDDALSAVDTETEEAILHALEARRGRRTTLVIAHRLSTLAHADQILVLEGGRITQRGSHAQLAGQPGLYRRLWQLQNAGGAA
jgi:ATP-binding cassette subfamily B protein